MSAFGSYPLRVQYEDTDFSGYVYHANYIKYCERARSEFTRARGIDQVAMQKDGIAFVVHHMECDWLKPARFGDELVVETEFKDIAGIRMVGLQKVKRGDDVLFTATVTVVLIDGRGRPIRVPPDMMQAFAQ